MNDLVVSESRPFVLTQAVPKLGSVGKTPGLKTASSTTSNTSANPLVTAFTQILAEALTGLADVTAQMASKRLAEFVEDRSRLRAFAQAAGWAPTSGGSSASSASSGSSSSSSSRTSSSGTSGSGSGDPAYRLLTALGQTLVQALQAGQQDATQAASTQADTDSSSNATDTIDATGTDPSANATDTTGTGGNSHSADTAGTDADSTTTGTGSTR